MIPIIYKIDNKMSKYMTFIEVYIVNTILDNSFYTIIYYSESYKFVEEMMSIDNISCIIYIVLLLEYI